jgi:hypothetical protein
VIVGGEIVLHDLLHDVLPDANAKPQLADLPAGRAGRELVPDVVKTKSALRVGGLRIEQDVELLRNVLDDDVQAGDPDIMVIDDETDGGGGHGLGLELAKTKRYRDALALVYLENPQYRRRCEVRRTLALAAR